MKRVILTDLLNENKPLISCTYSIMKILYKKSFTKAYQKFNKKRRDKIKEALSLFLINPFDERLHNHALSVTYKNKRSINV